MRDTCPVHLSLIGVIKLITYIEAPHYAVFFSLLLLPPSLVQIFFAPPSALSLGVKLPGREADYTSPSSAEVRNAWSYTSTHPIHFHGLVIN
jgi:hypothetical protein